MKWEEAYRCCSTVAAGWCCHTGSHTKLPFPTSFPLFLVSFPGLFSYLSGPLSSLYSSHSLRHAVTPSFLPTFTGRQTHTPTPAPAPLLLSRSCLTTSVKVVTTEYTSFLQPFSEVKVASKGNRGTQNLTRDRGYSIERPFTIQKFNYKCNKYPHITT